MISYQEQAEYWFMEWVAAIGRMYSPHCSQEYKDKVGDFAMKCQREYLILSTYAEKCTK